MFLSYFSFPFLLFFFFTFRFERSTNNLIAVSPYETKWQVCHVAKPTVRFEVRNVSIYLVGRAIGVYRESRLRIWVRMVKYLVTTPCPAPRPRWSRSSKTRYRTTLRFRYRSSPGPLAPPPSRISSRNLPRNQEGNCILETNIHAICWDACSWKIDRFDRFDSRKKKRKNLKKCLNEDEAREHGNKEIFIYLSGGKKNAHLLLSSCTPQVYVDTWPRRRHLRGRLD